MSAAWVIRLRRTIDNGTCTLAALDGALRMKALTAAEHEELTAYWHEVNDPPVEEPEEPTDPEVPGDQEEPVDTGNVTGQ